MKKLTLSLILILSVAQSAKIVWNGNKPTINQEDESSKGCYKAKIFQDSNNTKEDCK